MTPKSGYLIVYNSVQLGLWTVVLVSLVIAIVKNFPHSHNTISLDFATRAQHLAWLELIHAASGLGGGVSTTFVQCLGRFVVLVFVINAIPPIQHTLVTTVLLLSWSIADVVRYSFYLSALFGRPGKLLLWLRYSMFLILYPIGIFAEWLIYYYTLEFVDATQVYKVELPNSWNFVFDFGIWNRFVLCLYLYFGPYMFFHMLRQRQRKLN